MRSATTDIVVMLGAADAEAVEVAAETVRDGIRPGWVHWRGFSWDSPCCTCSKTR